MNKTMNTIFIWAISLTVATSSVITIDKIKIMRLNDEIAKQKEIVSELEEDVASFEFAMVAKNSAILEFMSKEKQLESDYAILEQKYEENLKRLNNLEKNQKKKMTKRFSEFPKITVGEDYMSWKKISVESTAYTKFENGDELGGRRWGNITASGVPVQYGVIAVDTDFIPFGTEVYIPALNKVFVALDTGSAIKGDIIDIYFDTLEECIKWGRKRNLEVYVNM